MRRVFVIVLMLAVMASVPALGFVVPAPDIQDNTSSTRIIPSDPKLPKYDNPTEIDLEDGNLHISFQGVFRGTGDDKELIAFIFVATPKKDMRLYLDRSEMFDSRGTRFTDWRNTWIGRERTTDREIIADIPMVIMRWLRVRPSDSSEFPTVARVNFRFNGQWFQYRNIKVEEWSVWENIRQELGL